MHRGDDSHSTRAEDPLFGGALDPVPGSRSRLAWSTPKLSIISDFRDAELTNITFIYNDGPGNYS